MRWEFFTRAAFRAAARPLGVACIALAMHVAALQGGEAPIADDAGTAAAIEAMGGVHGGGTGTEPRVDRARHIVTAPARMYGGARVADVAVGIGRPSPPRSNSAESPGVPMKKRLEGKVVCITGAGRGLGRALAERFSAEGASLVLGARTTPEIDELARTLGDAIAVQTDVRSANDCHRLVDAAMAEYERLDVMINNAGLAIYGPVDTLSENDIDVMIDTNVKGVIHGSIAAFKVMKAQRSGLIVNISSIAGKLHLPNEAVYGATKWAVNGFTGTLRLEAAAYDVKVTSVCPGGIDTPFWRAMDYYPFPDHIDPARDFMKPEEVAESVLEIALKSDRYVVPELVMVPLIPPR